MKFFVLFVAVAIFLTSIVTVYGHPNCGLPCEGRPIPDTATPAPSPPATPAPQAMCPACSCDPPPPNCIPPKFHCDLACIQKPILPEA